MIGFFCTLLSFISLKNVCIFFPHSHQFYLKSLELLVPCSAFPLESHRHQMSGCSSYRSLLFMRTSSRALFCLFPFLVLQDTLHFQNHFPSFRILRGFGRILFCLVVKYQCKVEENFIETTVLVCNSIVYHFKSYSRN